MSSSESEPVYRVVFLQQGEIWEVYARSVAQGGLFGFVEVEEVLFGQRSQLVVDPSEDRVRNEFEGVKRFYVPLHSVVRIDQVEKQGTPRVSKGPEGSGIVAPFPVPVVRPSKD